ncbi:hypothetical protein [Paenibacillus amylolyticus]|uniref:hypothetical protein n=1 Tax=Paenibacillus amylolyticus TaxID=1451 RepID=UPI001374F50C|nr:hypothetical protein [Paenibacillus amylolyticus]
MKRFYTLPDERIRNFRAPTPLLVVVEMIPDTLHDLGSPMLLLAGSIHPPLVISAP